MKRFALIPVLFLCFVIQSVTCLYGQPIKAWEVKLADAVVTNALILGTGTDSSFIFNGISSGTNCVFWLTGDGRLVSEISANWSVAGQIVYLSSSRS
jgi:hypothetical protein